MLSGHLDLPLSNDPATKLLPWIISVMVFLAMLMLAGALVLRGATASWEEGLSGRYTVQIPPVEGESAREADQRIERAIKILEEVAGVSNAQQVPPAEVAASLEPWLGAGTSVVDLPLPHLIDVRLSERFRVNLEQLQERLALAVKGSVIDDHGSWRHQIKELIFSLQALASAIILLIAGCAVSAVMFATRSGIAVYHDVIIVLHLIGATDDYIARQFQRHALRQAFRGGVVGALLVGVTLGVFFMSVAELDPLLMPEIRFTYSDWIILLIIPFSVCVIAMRTARATVLRELRQI